MRRREKNLRFKKKGKLIISREVEKMKKYALCICICTLFAAQLSSEDKDWSQLGHDSTHTFSSPTSIPQYLEIVWIYQYERKSCAWSEFYCQGTSPALVDGRVYFHDVYNLLCLSLRTGKVLYQVPAFSEYPYTPTVVDGKVYGAAERNLFRCMNASTGSPVWEKELPDLHMTNPLVTDSAVYVTGDVFNLYYSTPVIDPLQMCLWSVPRWSSLVALDKKTGEEIWQYSIADDSLFAIGGVGFPILVDETLFFFVDYYEDKEDYDNDLARSYLVCLDARTGTLKWKREDIIHTKLTDSWGILPFWTAYYEKKIYVGLIEQVMCIDTETQELLWESEFPGFALISVGSGVVVAGGGDWVSCFDAETGDELWKIPMRGSATPAMAGEEVFIGSSDGYLYRVDIKSGTVVESYHLGGCVCSPVVAHQHVVVGTSESKIYCLGQPTSYGGVGLTAGSVIVLLGLLVLKRTRCS